MARWHDFILGAITPFQHIPFNIRWRAFVFQPLAYLVYAMKYLPWCRPFRTIKASPYSVHFAKMRDGYLNRFIIFSPPLSPTAKKAPLHIDFHGGGFIGGIAEYDAPFLFQLSSSLPTPTLIIGIEYRCAPRYRFPNAHNDAVDTVRYILSPDSGLVEKYNLDLDCITMTGWSAGGNQAYSVAVRLSRGDSLQAITVRGIATFYAHLDLATPRLSKKMPSWTLENPKPPKANPIDQLVGDLMDSYIPGSSSPDHSKIGLAEYSPVNASIDEVPKRILFVVPRICPLVEEQRKLFEKVDSEEARAKGIQAQWLFYEKGFHGWLEVPERFIDAEERKDIFKAAINFIVDVQKENGYP